MPGKHGVPRVHVLEHGQIDVRPKIHVRVEKSHAPLLRSEPSVIEFHHEWRRVFDHGFHHPPRWRRRFDHPEKLARKAHPRGPVPSRESALALARRPPDHPVEFLCGRMKSPDVAAPQQIRPAHNAKALLLKRHIQQSNAGKEREDKR